MDDPVTITIEDVRSAGYCASGAKKWFAAYDLDFRAFLQEGIGEEQFLATGDAIAQDIVAKKKARADG